MSTAVQKTAGEEKAIEFQPFGAADKIKLSVKIVQNFIAAPTRTGKTCTDRDAMKFLMLCQAQRLNPFAGDAFLVGYDGQNGPVFSLITAHQAFLKRAETCADFEGMESGIILQSETGEITERQGDFHLAEESVVGGWAKVFRKGRKETYRRIRLDRFNTGKSQWEKDPAGMIVKCAEADALRSTFPTLLGGLYNEGEIVDISSVRTTVEPPVGRFESLAAPSEDRPPLAVESEVETAPEKQTPQQELAAAITGAGFVFENFRAWAEFTENVPDAANLKDFSQIGTADATRLLRGKAGILKHLNAAKGGAQ